MTSGPSPSCVSPSTRLVQRRGTEHARLARPMTNAIDVLARACNIGGHTITHGEEQHASQSAASSLRLLCRGVSISADLVRRRGRAAVGVRHAPISRR